MRSMLELLRGTPARRRIAVLGEMLELGREAGTLHRDIGRFAAEQGIDAVVGIRGAARFMVDEAMEAGLSGSAASFFDTPEEAGDFLRDYMRPGDAILFKGSRGVQVEKALERAFEDAAKWGQGIADALLAALRAALSRPIRPVPRVPLRHVADHVCEPDVAVSVRDPGAVADPQTARVSDRPAYPRRRTEVAPEEGGHTDHGRGPDHHQHSGADAAVGGPAAPLRLDRSCLRCWHSASSDSSTTTRR